VRILITGVAGFVGSHLLQHLLNETPDAEIHGTIMEHSHRPDVPQLICHALNLKDERGLTDLIEQVRPTQIYHLAAQASPKASFKNPWDTLENNIQTQVNILQACLTTQIQPRILIISSAEIYGLVPPEMLPATEDCPLQPRNPYAVSKIAQDMLGLQYFISHHLPILRVRPFNHIGPGQSEGFVAVDFAIQIARIEAGLQPPVMAVGNLAAQRDFMDVRDVVRAYRLVMEQGTPGDVYNVASGKTYSVQALLDTLLNYSTAKIDIQTDPARMLPADVPIIQGDASRLRQATGWQPTIPFEQSLLDVLNDCRERVARTSAANHRADAGQ
jgi:GDP-4-dehydro-6-deoxy-D-mannose reductase